MNSRLKNIATKIANYKNEINHNTFTKEEIEEGVDHVANSVKGGYVKEVLNDLLQEFYETKGDDIFELIQEYIEIAL